MARKLISNPNACTITHSMNILGSKWKPLIIYLLSCGSLRFGRLNILLPSLSKKVLTAQLKELESDGLIVRHSFSETPPRVEYYLSDKGKTLLPILREMSDWVINNYPEINFEECIIPLVPKGSSYK